MVEVQHLVNSIAGGPLRRGQALANDEHDRCMLEHVVEAECLHVIDTFGDDIVWHLFLHLLPSRRHPRVAEALDGSRSLVQFNLHQAADKLLALERDVLPDWVHVAYVALSSFLHDVNFLLAVEGRPTRDEHIGHHTDGPYVRLLVGPALEYLGR